MIKRSMEYFTSPHIYYLRPEDFLQDCSGPAGQMQCWQLYSQFKNPDTGKRYFEDWTVVMVQGNFCGYCTRLKPIFQQVAESMYPFVDFGTIQTDGQYAAFQDPDVMTHILGKPMSGVPQLVRMYRGKVVDVYDGKRTPQEITKWIMGA